MKSFGSIRGSLPGESPVAVWPDTLFQPLETRVKVWQKYLSPCQISSNIQPPVRDHGFHALVRWWQLNHLHRNNKNYTMEVTRCCSKLWKTDCYYIVQVNNKTSSSRLKYFNSTPCYLEPALENSRAVSRFMRLILFKTIVLVRICFPKRKNIITLLTLNKSKKLCLLDFVKPWDDLSWMLVLTEDAGFLSFSGDKPQVC